MVDTTILPQSGEFTGMISGDARVISGSSLHIKGMIVGKLTVERGAQVRISGMIDGSVINEGGEIDCTGMIVGK